MAATDKVKPSVRIFLFFSILSHILYISPHTEILAQLSHLKTPTFCSSHSHPILCAAVFNFCHHHRYLNCERFTVVPVQMHSPPPLPVTFARHTLCCGETGVLCLTPGQSSSSLIISSNLLRVCAPARLVLIFSGSEVTWNVMIVHNTAVARRRVLFLVNRARFTTVSGQGQALAPPPVLSTCVFYHYYIISNAFKLCPHSVWAACKPWANCRHPHLIPLSCTCLCFHHVSCDGAAFDFCPEITASKRGCSAKILRNLCPSRWRALKCA